MFMILKGFVELTDPAIIIAKLIIDVANAIVMATLAVIEQGLTMAKMIAEGAALAAEGALMSAEMQLQIAGGLANSILGGISVAVDGTTVQAGSFYKIELEGASDAWKVEVLDTADGVSLADFEKSIPEGQERDSYDGFKTNFNKLDELFKVFIEARAVKKSIESDVKRTINDLEAFRADAKKTMQDLFSSPYLLPGLWAALVPSMLPYWGGIVPPPLFVGPPSTIPGMIYLALLLIDAIDEKRHNDIDNSDDPDCDNQL
jgi:hypothetical protein